jgi:hypothetical protein
MTMQLLLLAWLLLALFSERLRRAPAVWLCRFGRALSLWRVLHKPWRVAWRRACREIAR